MEIAFKYLRDKGKISLKVRAWRGIKCGKGGGGGEGEGVGLSLKDQCPFQPFSV